jgi:hypothetical protein
VIVIHITISCVTDNARIQQQKKQMTTFIVNTYYKGSMVHTVNDELNILLRFFEKSGNKIIIYQNYIIPTT